MRRPENIGYRDPVGGTEGITGSGLRPGAAMLAGMRHPIARAHLLLNSFERTACRLVDAERESLANRDIRYHSSDMVIDPAPYRVGHPRLATNQREWVEQAALGAALLCLFHCLALPLLLVTLPSFDRLLVLPPSIHLWLLAFAVPTSLFALVTGVLKHRNPAPLVGGAAGLILIALGAIVFAGLPTETSVTVLGSLTLVAAHIANWRLRHRHPVSSATSFPSGAELSAPIRRTSLLTKIL